jgi:hypothetical protein
MADIKRYFFSNDNLNKLNNKLGDHFEIDNEESFRAIRELLKKQMNNIFIKNKANLNKLPIPKMLKYLNEKSMEAVITVTNDVKNRVKQQNNHNGRSNTQQQRQPVPQRQPAPQQRQMSGSGRDRVRTEKQESNDGLIGMGSDMGGYAPIASGDGEYITADGRMGKKFLTGVNTNDFYNKNNDDDDPMQRYAKMRSDYENGMGLTMNGQQNGNINNNMMMNGGHNEHMMGYNPNIEGNTTNNLPSIDFSLDGGGISTKRRRNQDNLMQNSQNNGQFNQQHSFDGYDNNNYTADIYGGIEQFGGNIGGSIDQHGTQYNQGNMNQYNQSNMNQYNQGNMNQYNQGNMNQYNQGNMNLQSNVRGMGQQQQIGQNATSQYGQQVSQYGQINSVSQYPQLMVQPTQYTNYNKSNLNIGQTGYGDMEHLIKTNEKLCKTVGNKSGINPQLLQTMDAKQTEKMLKQLAKLSLQHKTNNNSDTDSSDTDNNSVSSDSSTEKYKKPKNKSDKLAKLVGALAEMKNKNNESKNKLNKVVKNVVESVVPKDSKTKTKTKKKIESSSESSTDTESEKDTSDSSSVSDSENEKKSNKKIENTKKQVSNKKDVLNKITTKILNVNSKDYESNPILYSDYLVDFDKEFGDDLKNVVDIKITDIKIPTIPEINDTCNTLIINYTNDDSEESNELTFPDGKYEINEIIELINDTLSENNCNIIANVKNDKVIFKHTDNENFTLDCSGKSIGKYLGFNKELYENKSEYVAEKLHVFIPGTKYMYIKNIASDTPFAQIEEDGSFKQNITTFESPISKLSCMIIQFKPEITTEKKFINFGKEPHTITFTFTVM